jgi:hypothetical protein
LGNLSFCKKPNTMQEKKTDILPQKDGGITRRDEELTVFGSRVFGY